MMKGDAGQSQEDSPCPAFYKGTYFDASRGYLIEGCLILFAIQKTRSRFNMRHLRFLES